MAPRKTDVKATPAASVTGLPAGYAEWLADHEPGGVTRHWVMERTCGRCFCAFGTKAEAAAAFTAV
jgi:hypothetical protein